MCTKIIIMATKGCGQLISNDTHVSDSWFSGVKTAMALGVDYCGPEKTSRKFFFLATIEKLMKDWPRGLYLVMKIDPRVTDGIPLMDIEYKYNYIGRSYGLLLLMWLEVLNQVIPIYLVSLTFILMFLFTPLLVLT